MKGNTIERFVNGIARINLEEVKLAPYVCCSPALHSTFMISNDSNFEARIKWDTLPPGVELEFLTPVAVKYCNNTPLNATIRERIESGSGNLIVPLSLQDRMNDPDRIKCVANSFPPASQL